MLKSTGLTESVGQSAAVSLLDWYLLEDELILIMEKPASCSDLFEYLIANGGSLEERQAKVQMVEDFFCVCSVFNSFHSVQIPAEKLRLSLYITWLGIPLLS